MVPSIWILELDRLNKKLDCLCSLNNTENTTALAYTDPRLGHSFSVGVESLVGYANQSDVTYQVTSLQDERDNHTTSLNSLMINITYEDYMMNGTTEGHVINYTDAGYSSEQTTFASHTSRRDQQLTVLPNVSTKAPVATKAPDIVSKVIILKKKIVSG